MRLPVVLVVQPGNPATTLKDVVEWLRTQGFPLGPFEIVAAISEEEKAGRPVAPLLNSPVNYKPLTIEEAICEEEKIDPEIVIPRDMKPIDHRLSVF